MMHNITIPRFPKTCDFDIFRLQFYGKVDRMKFFSSVSFRRALLLGAVTVATTGFVANPAQARVFVAIGVPFFGFGPAFTPYPYYYPPAYYPPPPVYYTPPGYNTAAPAYSPVPSNRVDRGLSCHASAYVCPMDRPVANGESCYCIGNGGQKVFGRAG